jgi:hypothetical protein
MEPYSLWFNGLVVLARYGTKNEVRRDARREEEEMHSVINLAGRGAARFFSCGLVVIGFMSCSGRRPGAATFLNTFFGLGGRQDKKKRKGKENWDL